MVEEQINLESWRLGVAALVQAHYVVNIELAGRVFGDGEAPQRPTAYAWDGRRLTIHFGSLGTYPRRRDSQVEILTDGGTERLVIEAPSGFELHHDSTVAQVR